MNWKKTDRHIQLSFFLGQLELQRKGQEEGCKVIATQASWSKFYLWNVELSSNFCMITVQCMRPHTHHTHTVIINKCEIKQEFS